MRRLGLVLVAALAAAGCGSPVAVVVSAARPGAVAPPIAPAPTTTAAPTTTTPATTPTTTTVAPPPATTTTAPVPTVATHDATLGALEPPARALPVAVEAGTVAGGPVVPAGADPSTGELAVPAEAGVVAWYEFGPAPGQPGSAVLAGHVDWRGVPGIFFRLQELQPGDPVRVTMSDGSVLGFHVVAADLVDKPALPRAEVFARSGPPTLTLVTCGGEFDASSRHYRSNVVVTALPD